MEFPIISFIIFLPILFGFLFIGLGNKYSTIVKYISLLISVVIFLTTFLLYFNMLTEKLGGSYSFVEGPIHFIPNLAGIDYYVGIDGLSGPMILLTSIISILVILGSWDLVHKSQSTYYGFLLLFIGALIGVFASINLLMFFIFWELVLIPMFLFIGIWGGSNKKYAAMKFLIYTHVGGMIMLIGIIGLYLFSGLHTLNINELVNNVPIWLQLYVSITMIIGFGFKLPMFPFHTWLPDAHVEAPAPISVFLAALLLKMGAYGFLRINLQLLYDVSLEYAWVYMSLGIITMFYGAIVALKQSDLKRMIAMTSISHMGFVLLGAFSGNSFGISGAVFQMFSHGLAVGLLFMLTGYIHENAGTRIISNLKGLKITMPRTSVLFICGALAAMGAPIFSNFLSEFMVIVGAISVDIRYALVMLIPIIVVGYFLWTIKRSIFSETTETKKRDLTTFSTIHLLLYLVPLVVTLIAPWIILDPVLSFIETYNLAG